MSILKVNLPYCLPFCWRALPTVTCAMLVAGLGIGGAAFEARAGSSPYKDVLVEEGRSRSLCESKPGRIFVETAEGRACVAYFATAGQDDRREAVMFLDGDVNAERFADPKAMAVGQARLHQLLQGWADKLKIRYVSISRLGVNGSSGHHGRRRMPAETHIMNRALDLLKARLGLDRIVLAGQSGGSTISASLLTLGRRDVTCAVLGSGAFELVDLHHGSLVDHGRKVSVTALDRVMLDPARDIGGIKSDPQRRIFILGDEADTRTPFDQQQRFATALSKNGHHARLIAISGGGELDHLATRFTIPTAGACLNRLSDEKIATANRNLSHKADAAEVRAQSPPPSASMALMRATE